MKKLFACIVASIAVTTSAQSYTIKPGDTLLGIANKHGVTYSQLLKANPGLDPDYIKSGFSIKIPEPVKAVNTSPTVVHPASRRPVQREGQQFRTSYASQYITPTGRTTITVVEND